MTAEWLPPPRGLSSGQQVHLCDLATLLRREDHRREEDDIGVQDAVEAAREFVCDVLMPAFDAVRVGPELLEDSLITRWYDEVTLDVRIVEWISLSHADAS